MSDDNDDIISSLIELGIIAFIGYGFYRILKSSGSFKEGDKVKEAELAELLVLAEADERKIPIKEREHYGHCKNDGCTYVGPLHFNDQCDDHYYDDDDDDAP